MDKEIIRGLSLLGITIADVLGSTGVGYGLGYLGHHQLGGPEWIILVLSLMGFAHGVYRLTQHAKRYY